MAYTTKIVHEMADFYVSRVGVGHYEIYKIGSVASTKCATIHFSNRPEHALERSIAECNRRQENHSV